MGIDAAEIDTVEIPEGWFCPVRPNLCLLVVMYQCNAGPALSQQQHCRHFDKSSQREECMYRHFSDPVLCDNYRAQGDTK